MKTIYIVRHGESESNAADRFNTTDVLLSEKGKAQASEIAERCSRLSFEAIVSSPMRRAKDTVEAISVRVGMPIEFSDLFVERRMPSTLRGKSKADPEVRKVYKMFKDNFDVAGFRYEDGENFQDVKDRALKALAYLEHRPEENIVVVTHGFFTTVLAAAVIFGAELTATEFLKILSRVQIVQNTSLSVLRFDEPDTLNRDHGRGDGWQLRVWNDHAHL